MKKNTILLKKPTKNEDSKKESESKASDDEYDEIFTKQLNDECKALVQVLRAKKRWMEIPTVQWPRR